MRANSLISPRAALQRGAACLTLSLILPAGAQSQAPTAAAGEGQASTYPPVTVTAPPLSYRQFDRVEITGSSIIRKEQSQALPVISMTREELRRAGVKTVAEAIQTLPMMANFSELAQMENPAGGYANAVLHGIPNATLVLVNGRRLAPFGRQTIAGPERSGYDLNTLPLVDVERIEVLSDGASSLYGTDAIAGVVNIIMRNERKGLEISVDQTQPRGHAGQGVLTSLGWGRGSLSRDGYSMLVAAEVFSRDALRGASRPEYAQGQYQFTHLGQRYAVDGSWVTDKTAPGTFYSPATDTTAARWANALYQNGACAGASVPAWGQAACKYNQYAQADLYPAQDSKRLHARMEVAALIEGTVFADLVLGQHADQSASRRWSPLDPSPAVSASPAAYDHAQAVALGFDPASTRINWLPDLPLLQARRTQQNWSMVAGVKGLWNAWDYRLQAYRSQAQAARLFETVGYGGLGSIPNQQLLSPLDAANPLTTALQTLRGQWVEMDKGTTQMDALEWRASRPVLEREGKDVSLGLGLDARRESTQFANTANASTVQPSFQASRSVWAGYAELQIPVTSTWDVNTGLRHDRYSDVGETTNGKVSTRWAVTPQWALRGALGTGFRAPTVGQTQTLGQGFSFAQTAYANPCTADLVALAQSLKTATGVNGTCDSSRTLVVYGNGNPDLKPEKSHQTTLGVAFTPHANLRLSVDYWNVKVTDMLRYASDTAAVQSPLNAQYFRLDANGRLALYLPTVNLGEMQKSGLDLEAQWRVPTAWGRFQVLGQGTYMLQSRQRVLNSDPFTSDLGQYSASSDAVVPRWRGRLVLSWATSDWDSHLIFHHTSGYVDTPVRAWNLDALKYETVEGRRVSAFTTVDWVLRHQFSAKVDGRLGLSNVFNAKAPLSFTQTAFQIYGANTVYSQLWGRVLQLGVTARF